MADRLAQVSGHLTNTYGRGLLVGEVAIITGDAALLFAKEGAKVVVSDLDEKKAQVVVDEIKAAGGDALAVGGDVGAEDFPQKVLEATIKKYGKLNHIVNNAGFTFDRMLHTTPDDAFDIIIKVHVRAPFRLVRAAAPYMRIKVKSSIINVSSVSGLHGSVGQINYAAAKSGEWGLFGVRANTVAFGFVQTRLTQAKEEGASIEIDGKKVALGIPKAQSAGAGTSAIPLGRAATPDEAAAAMLFLASPLASYVSGHTLEVTGGQGI
ncbi:uncharacterized protein B0H18DRAFT_1024814 [Fomitopsis serialis]|uniref:uncharacterized protein n=1 Tax=Fomitopsis serialis TaxID=139415 RepID=UPI00200828BA|nr:uncharacterized protein B0H18DRAFT_1024814 [Neoantrodia serialis]KAH9920318.1 hypothetical protein B0H18DRAFT_1024814 [Neoantrodia serialis]